MAKSCNQKGKILYLQKMLSETTSQNPVTMQEILAKLAVASAGESVYRDELLKVKKQMEDERKTSNKLIQTLTRRVEELEQNVTSLSQDKARYLAQIADLQLQLKEYQDKLDKVTDEKNALQKDRDQLAALVELNSPENAVPEVLNFSEMCIKSETMLAFLAEEQIYVSSASACGRGQPSHTLAAMGRDPLAIDTAIRVSFCADNTPEDVDAFLNRFEDGMKHLQKIRK